MQIAKLVGSTKPTVDAIRNKTHPATSTLKPTDPVSLGLCTAEELEKALRRAQRRQEREAKQSAPANVAEDLSVVIEEEQPAAETSSETAEETPVPEKASL